MAARAGFDPQTPAARVLCVVAQRFSWARYRTQAPLEVTGTGP